MRRNRAGRARKTPVSFGRFLELQECVFGLPNQNYLRYDNRKIILVY